MSNDVLRYGKHGFFYHIHMLILEESRISAKSIAELLGISRDRVGSIIHEDLNKLVACFLAGRAKDLPGPPVV
jgi:predicted XRE-type DNA-binding protein